ncbi:MAG: T9SS type A sorting domain-containing protein [Flavobacteriales bacterium]
MTLTGEGIQQVTVYDAAGKRVAVLTPPRAGAVRLTLPAAAGTYQLAVSTPKGVRLLRVVRLSGQ